MQHGQGGGAQISAGLQLVPTHATRQLQLFRPQQEQGETAQPVPEHREAGSPGSQLSQVALQHPVADPGHPSAPLLGQAPEHETICMVMLLFRVELLRQSWRTI